MGRNTSLGAFPREMYLPQGVLGELLREIPRDIHKNIPKNVPENIPKGEV